MHATICPYLCQSLECSEMLESKREKSLSVLLISKLYNSIKSIAMLDFRRFTSFFKFLNHFYFPFFHKSNTAYKDCHACNRTKVYSVEHIMSYESVINLATEVLQTCI